MQDETQRLEQSPPAPPATSGPAGGSPAVGGQPAGGPTGGAPPAGSPPAAQPPVVQPGVAPPEPEAPSSRAPRTPTTPPPGPPEAGLPPPRGLDNVRAEREAAARNASGPSVAAVGAVDQPRDYPLDHSEPVYLPLALSVGAGFKFGCGFMLAVSLTALVLFLVSSIVFFVATLVGIPLPLVPAQ